MLSVRASTNQRAMQAGAENTRVAVNTAHIEAEAEALNGAGKTIGALGEAYVKEMKERENRKLLAAINEFNKGMDEIKDPPPDGGGEEPVPDMPPSFAEQAKRVQDDVLARSGISDRAVKERFYLQSERNVIAREELLENRRKEKAQLERDERVRSAGATAVELAVASGHDGDIDNAIASQLELLESAYADEGNEALMARRSAAVRDTVQAAAGARIERGDYTGAKEIVSRYKDELDAADYSRLQKVVGGYEEAGKRDAANKARYERLGYDAAAAHAEIEAENEKDPLRSQREIRSYDAYARMEKRRRDNVMTIAQKGCIDEISAMVKEGTVSEAALEGMTNRLLDESGLTGSERERLEDSLGDMYGRMINAPRSYPLVKAGLIRAAIEGELSFEQVEDAWESRELSKRDYVYFLDKADALHNESNDMADDAFDKVWLKKLDGMGLDDYSKAEAMGVINQSLDDGSKKGMDRIETAGKLMEYADKGWFSGGSNLMSQADAAGLTGSKHAFEQDRGTAESVVMPKNDGDIVYMGKRFYEWQGGELVEIGDEPEKGTVFWRQLYNNPQGGMCIIDDNGEHVGLKWGKADIPFSGGDRFNAEVAVHPNDGKPIMIDGRYVLSPEAKAAYVSELEEQIPSVLAMPLKDMLRNVDRSGFKDNEYMTFSINASIPIYGLPTQGNVGIIIDKEGKVYFATGIGAGLSWPPVSFGVSRDFVLDKEEAKNMQRTLEGFSFSSGAQGFIGKLNVSDSTLGYGGESVVYGLGVMGYKTTYLFTL